MTRIKYKEHEINIDDNNYYNPASVQINPRAALILTGVLAVASGGAMLITHGVATTIAGIFDIGFAASIGSTISLFVTTATAYNYIYPSDPETHMENKHFKAIYDSVRFTGDYYLSNSLNDHDEITTMGENKDLVHENTEQL